MNPCFFFGLCNMFSFFFFIRFKLNIATATWAVFLRSVQYCPSLCYHTCFDRTFKLGFRGFFFFLFFLKTFPFNRNILVAQKKTFGAESFVTKWLWNGSVTKTCDEEALLETALKLSYQHCFSSAPGFWSRYMNLYLTFNKSTMGRGGEKKQERQRTKKKKRPRMRVWPWCAH